jgi:hypothetical protein
MFLLIFYNFSHHRALLGGYFHKVDAGLQGGDVNFLI